MSNAGPMDRTEITITSSMKWDAFFWGKRLDLKESICVFCWNVWHPNPVLRASACGSGPAEGGFCSVDETDRRTAFWWIFILFYWWNRQENSFLVDIYFGLLIKQTGEQLSEWHLFAIRLFLYVQKVCVSYYWVPRLVAGPTDREAGLVLCKERGGTSPL